MIQSIIFSALVGRTVCVSLLLYSSIPRAHVSFPLLLSSSCRWSHFSRSRMVSHTLHSYAHDPCGMHSIAFDPSFLDSSTFLRQLVSSLHFFRYLFGLFGIDHEHIVRKLLGSCIWDVVLQLEGPIVGMRNDYLAALHGPVIYGANCFLSCNFSIFSPICTLFLRFVHPPLTSPMSRLC